MTSEKQTPSIALWHPFTARSVGWAEKQLASVHSKPHSAALRHLAKSRGAHCRVEYLTDRRWPAFEEHNGVEWRFWPRSFRAVPGVSAFRREWSLSALAAAALDPADVTIIYTSGHGGAFTRALAKTLHCRRRPYVTMIGGLHATVTGAQRQYFEQACAIAALNSTVRDNLLAAGFPKEKVVIVRLGVDTNYFAPLESVEAPVGQSHVLYVGRVVELKGIDRLIRAIASVRVRHPTVVLHIVGPPSDPLYFARLRRLVTDLGLGDCVHFRGAVEYQALPEVYRSASLLVLPSFNEGFPMVVAESMACGTPVVAFKNSGGPPDIIADGVDGRLVDENELGSAISELLADPSGLSAMRRAARRTALEANSDAVTSSAFENLVSRALACG